MRRNGGGLPSALLAVVVVGSFFPATVCAMDHPSASSQWQRGTTWHTLDNDSERSERTTTRSLLESNVPTSAVLSFSTPPPTPLMELGQMGTASPTQGPTSERIPDSLIPAYMIAIDTDPETNENVYTSSCPTAVANETIGSNASAASSTVFTQVIAFDYLFTTARLNQTSTDNVTSSSNMTSVSHDDVLWTVEFGLHEYLSRLYLGDCQTRMRPFVVSLLDSSPLDAPSMGNSSGVCADAELCHVVNGYITVSVYYPRIVAANDTTVDVNDTTVDVNATETRRRLENITSEDGIEILTDPVLAESFADALEAFFVNKTIETNTESGDTSAVARLDFIAISNFRPDQYTYDGTGDPPTNETGIRGTTFASPSGSINYSWGATVLGAAILGLVLTAIMAVRFRLRHSKRALESVDLETLPASPSDRGDLASPDSDPARSKRPRSSARSVTLDQVSPETILADEPAVPWRRWRRQNRDTEASHPQGSTVVSPEAEQSTSDRADDDVTTVASNPTHNQSFDYTKKHSFVFNGDDYWDDNDDDTLLDHEASIEVLYRQEAKNITSSPYRWHAIRNSNPPRFLSSILNDAQDSDSKRKSQSDYDPYGSRDNSIPDTLDL